MPSNPITSTRQIRVQKGARSVYQAILVRANRFLFCVVSSFHISFASVTLTLPVCVYIAYSCLYVRVRVCTVCVHTRVSVCVCIYIYPWLCVYIFAEKMWQSNQSWLRRTSGDYTSTHADTLLNTPIRHVLQLEHTNLTHRQVNLMFAQHGPEDKARARVGYYYRHIIHTPYWSIITTIDIYAHPYWSTITTIDIYTHTLIEVTAYICFIVCG